METGDSVQCYTVYYRRLDTRRPLPGGVGDGTAGVMDQRPAIIFFSVSHKSVCKTRAANAAANANANANGSSWVIDSTVAEPPEDKLSSPMETCWVSNRSPGPRSAPQVLYWAAFLNPALNLWDQSFVSKVK